MRQQNQNALDAIVTTLRQRKLDVLVASGDLTTFGDKASIRRAQDYLNHLATECHIGRDQRIVIPGNHDSILKYYFGWKRPFDDAYPDYEESRRFDHTGTRFAIFPFDSSIDPGWSLLWMFRANKGRVTPQAFNKFQQALQKTSSGSFKIAVLHHHPLPIPYVDTKSLTVMENGGAFIAEMQEHNISLILHGHEHHPYSCTYQYNTRRDSIIVVAAGGCQAGDQNSFNLIHIVPKHRISIIEYAYNGASFVRKPPKRFELQEQRP